MPFGERLDFDLSDIEVRNLTNFIGLLSDPKNPWCMDDVMGQLKNAALWKFLYIIQFCGPSVCVVRAVGWIV